jgi:hypothetical protein
MFIVEACLMSIGKAIWPPEVSKHYDAWPRPHWIPYAVEVTKENLFPTMVYPNKPLVTEH